MNWIKYNYNYLLHICCILISVFAPVDHHSVSAQITPDESLGDENSQVTANSETEKQIEGGAIRGSNLFHSFREFNVGDGEIVDFANPNGITNIFSRVTGNNISNILGDLGVLGEANLFLINPNGIVFGENASLNLNGSFVATTANSLNFVDGNQFTANPTSGKALLTISTPNALQFGNQPGKIINRAQSYQEAYPNKIPDLEKVNSLLFPAGLKIKPNKTIALIGGEVILQGGNLTASGGNIRLGSVGANSLVGLNITSSSINFDYQAVNFFFEITLTTRNGFFIFFPSEETSLSSFLDASSDGSVGSINLQGRNINIVNGSQLQTFTLGELSGGNIEINATEKLTVRGTGFFGNSAIFTVTNGDGNAGDIAINTQKLVVQDRGTITTSAVESIDTFTGEIILPQGDAGDIEIQAQSLSLDINSQISAETTQSNGGNINLQVDNDLRLRNQSAISASVGGNGNGGNIDIATQFLITSPQDNSDITANAELGEGGNISIDASGIFGISFQEQSTSLSDITVSSNFGTDGTVSLIDSDVQVRQTESDFSVQFVTVLPSFTPNYCYTNQQSQYIKTGRGGVPLASQSSLISEYTWEDWRMLNREQQLTTTEQSNVTHQNHYLVSRRSIQGWLVNQQGEVVLTASPITVTPHAPAIKHPSCSFR